MYKVSNIIFAMSLMLAIATTQVRAQALARETYQEVEGIQFFEGSWTEVLAEAERTGKAIFVDVYTVWCGPCKMMAAKIFPLKDVGKVYNDLFINYKLDAEKGEGIDIAKKYNVQSYPTYLYLRSDGELIYRGGGYNPDPEPFIKQAKTAASLADDPYTLSKMTADYETGKRDREFLKKYISRLNQLEMDTSDPLDAYLENLSQKERMQAGTMQFLAKNVTGIHTETFLFLLEHVAEVYNAGNFTEQTMSQMHISNLLYRECRKALGNRDYKKAGGVLAYIERLPKREGYHADQDQYYNFKMQYFGGTDQTDQLIETAYAAVRDVMGIAVEEVRQQDRQRYEQFMRPYREGKKDSTDIEFKMNREYMVNAIAQAKSRRLYSAAQFVENFTKEEKVLEDALEWIGKAMELVPDSHMYIALNAQLLYKTGDSKTAIEMLKEAIKMSEEQQSEGFTENYRSILEKMKQDKLG